MPEKEKPLRDEALAGEFTDKGLKSKSVHERIEKFTIAKHRQDAILNHLRLISSGKASAPTIGVVDYPKVIGNISECFNRLTLYDYYTVGETRLIKATSCKKHLLCAPCAIRRASKAVQAYLTKFDELMSLESDLEPHFLTLTVKNGFDLQERFEHLQKSMKSLLKSRRNYASRGDSFNEFCKIQGAVYSYEVSRSCHGWHPHIHMILLLKKGEKIDFNLKNPKQSRLSKDWKKITGDSFIVDVRPITGNPAEGFIEVFKYALKFSDMKPAQTIEAYSVLRGKRLQGSFGVFRGVEIPETMNEDPLANLPFIELIYQYIDRNFTLKKHTHVEV